MQEDSSGRMSQQPTPAGDDRSPFVAFYQPPRLSIIHLLWWIAVAAVLMSLTASLGRWSGDSLLGKAVTTECQTFTLTVSMISRIVLAAGLVGLFLIGRDRIRHAPGRLQPGHWILLGQCTGQVIILPGTLILAFCVPSAPTTTGSTVNTMAIFVPSIIGQILVSIIFMAGARRCPAERRWRRVLAIWALAALLAACSDGIYLIPGLPFGWLSLVMITAGLAMIVACLASWISLGVAAVHDLSTGNRRDWIHWLGVATVFGTIMLGLLTAAWHLATRV